MGTNECFLKEIALKTDIKNLLTLLKNDIERQPQKEVRWISAYCLQHIKQSLMDVLIFVYEHREPEVEKALQEMRKATDSKTSQ